MTTISVYATDSGTAPDANGRNSFWDAIYYFNISGIIQDIATI